MRSIIEILSAVTLTGAVVVALILWLGEPDATQTQREAFLRERWELAEARAAECARLCEADRELAERASEAWRMLSRKLGLEVRK